jgi:thioredoxin reductase
MKNISIVGAGSIGLTTAICHAQSLKSEAELVKTTKNEMEDTPKGKIWKTNGNSESILVDDHDYYMTRDIKLRSEISLLILLLLRKKENRV